MEMYIVLAITLFMMVMFIWNKVPHLARQVWL